MADRPAATQVRRPRRAVARTVFQAVVAFTPMAPLIYQAATNEDPAAASGLAGAALAIMGGVTRVMALPAVERFLQQHLSWLAAAPKPRREPKHLRP